MADLGSLLGGLGIGGNIGKAIVQLELDTKKYSAEMQAAEAKTVTSTKSMGTSTSRFGSLASTAFLAAGAAAVAGLGLSVKAAIEAQEAQQRLHNTIENAPQLAASAEKAFLDQAEAIRSVTGADDEAVISGQALLGQMGLTEDAILKLTPLVVDLSEKNGVDLNAAFKAVGKAATGSTGALARYIGTVEKGETPAETLQNVLDKLGRSAGFAAEQAKTEPWRVLQSDLEEISEDIGTALLPAIESLATSLHNLVPLIEGVAKGIQFLPLIQMTEDIGSAGDGVHKFGNALIDTIPVLGHFVNLTGIQMSDAVGKVVQDLPGFAEGLDQVAKAGKGVAHSGNDARKSIVSFAHMTGQELEDWRDKTVQSFGDFVLALDESADTTKITRREFRDAVHAMLQNSRDLSQAMRTLSKEKWVNDEFVQFLSEQGPEWLIGFANLNKEQQRKFQEDWERSNHKLQDANRHFDTMLGLLGDLDTGTTKHTVEIHYKYVGFDPSKPGMSNQQQ